MWNKQCINYNENDLVNFTSATERTISVLPVSNSPYILIRRNTDYTLWWSTTYFFNKYKLNDPIKEWEICGPLVTLIIELATKYKYKQVVL